MKEITGGIDNLVVNVENIKTIIEMEAMTNAEKLSQIRKGNERVWAKPPVYINLSAIRASISSAEMNSNAGEEVSPMEQFHGIYRKLAIFVGKAVVYLTSFITYKQRHFNRDCILTLKLITDSIENIDKSIKTLTRKVEELQQTNKDEY